MMKRDIIFVEIRVQKAHVICALCRITLTLSPVSLLESSVYFCELRK